jgi:hypothetical protein
VKGFKMKVENFYNKNQFVIYGDGSITFQSYDSTIAIIKNNKITLGLHWDYSNTTLKHLYLFLNDYYYSLYQKIMNSNNKRKAIQKMIDNNLINYNESMV